MLGSRPLSDIPRTLSMTFGRPCTIPESYVKLDMPLKDTQVLSSTLKSETYQQLDGWFFTAAMSAHQDPPPSLFPSLPSKTDPVLVSYT
jgi:hypothetical protein